MSASKVAGVLKVLIGFQALGFRGFGVLLGSVISNLTTQTSL